MNTNSPLNDFAKLDAQNESDRAATFDPTEVEDISADDLREFKSEEDKLGVTISGD